MTESRYRLYGVDVDASLPLFDRDLLGPHDDSAKTRVALVPVRGQPPRLRDQLTFSHSHGRQINLYTKRETPEASRANQPWQFVVEGLLAFHWRGQSNSIEFEVLDAHEGKDRISFWFVHVFLPFFLAMEHGYDFLHAVGVEIDRRIVLLVAPSTGGKSTLGDYFLRQGHAMISDDKVATFRKDGRFWAAPSHPYHRPYRELETLGQPMARFAVAAGPVAAFYLLERAGPDSTVNIEEVTGYRKFEQLLRNYLFDIDDLQRRRLRWLGTLSDQSRVFRLTRPWDLERQHETYEAIIRHSRSLRGG